MFETLQRKTTTIKHVTTIYLIIAAILKTAHITFTYQKITQHNNMHSKIDIHNLRSSIHTPEYMS